LDQRETRQVQRDLIRTLAIIGFIGVVLATLTAWSRSSPTLHASADAIARWLKLN
jgi:hypothetical protein